MIRKIFTSFKFFVFLPLIKWISDKREYRYLKELIKSADRSELINKKIVINTAVLHKKCLDVELFIGLILALAGAKVKILLDDGILLHYDSFQVDRLSNIKKLKKNNLSHYPFRNLFDNIFSLHFFWGILDRNIRKKVIKTIKDKNIEYISYSTLFDRKNLNLENWQELKKHALSSTIRFFKTSYLDFNDEYVKFFYKLSLMNAVISRNISENVLKKIKPDIIINPHGSYSIHGTAYEYFKKTGVKSLVWAGINNRSENTDSALIIDTLLQTLTQSKFWQKYKNCPVTEEMEKKVENYFNKRLRGNKPDIIFFKLMDEKNLFKINKNDGFKYHIGIFPNVLWDGNISDKHIIFNDYVDWVFSTIDYLKNRKDIKIYLKAHPSEALYCGKEEEGRIINVLKKKLNLNEIKNLELIHPENRINTYEFVQSLDLGIVYDGFLGLEMPYLGVLTINVAKGGCQSVEEGNYLISSREEYFRFLDNIDGLKEDFRKNYEKYRKNIIRYLYWFLFEISFNLPIIRYYYPYGTGQSYLKKKDLNIDPKLLNILNEA